MRLLPAACAAGKQNAPVANHEGIRIEAERARGQLNQQPPELTSPSTKATEAATPLRSSTAGHTTRDSFRVWPTRNNSSQARPVETTSTGRTRFANFADSVAVLSDRFIPPGELINTAQGRARRMRTLDPTRAEPCMWTPGCGDSGAQERYVPPSGGATES